MKQIKYKSGIIILFNIILFIAMYVGIALLRYKTFINTGIGAGISGNAIDNISDINEIKNSFIVLIVLIVTHDNEIANQCNRIIKLKDGKITCH